MSQSLSNTLKLTWGVESDLTRDPYLQDINDANVGLGITPFGCIVDVTMSFSDASFQLLGSQAQHDMWYGYHLPS